MDESIDMFDLLMSGADLPDITEAPREYGVKLGDYKCGDVVTIGRREYIVLEHKEGWTSVITKDFAKQMAFGRNADYLCSDIRRWCNNEFYNELADAVGVENILEHTVDLTADDGTGKGVVAEDFVSILTTDKYRKYREFIPAYGRWWYTATRVNADNNAYARDVCYVRSCGVLGWSVSDHGLGGVRPFCVLNSSIYID